MTPKPTTDLWTMIERLKAAGYDFVKHEVSKRSGGTTFFFTNPEGTPVEFNWYGLEMESSLYV